MTAREFQEYVKTHQASVMEAKLQGAAAVAARTAIAFTAATIALFARELLNNPEVRDYIAKAPKSEVSAALRTALMEIWGAAVRIIVETLRRGISEADALQSAYFAEEVMRHIEDAINEVKTEEEHKGIETETRWDEHGWHW